MIQSYNLLFRESNARRLSGVSTDALSPFLITTDFLKSFKRIRNNEFLLCNNVRWCSVSHCNTSLVECLTFHSINPTSNANTKSILFILGKKINKNEQMTATNTLKIVSFYHTFVCIAQNALHQFLKLSIFMETRCKIFSPYCLFAILFVYFSWLKVS